MNTAYNNFYLIEPHDEKVDGISAGIYKYENTINVDIWRGNIPLSLGKVVSTESNTWVGSITNKVYSKGDLVVYDPTCIIKHFADGTKLIRDDAIVCLFNEDEDAPGANMNEVVVRIERNVGLEMQNIVNGFFGTVVDIQYGEYYDNDDKIKSVKPGDKVILVNPYKTGSESANDVFKKVSTSNGFYIVGEVDGIACKVENEK